MLEEIPPSPPRPDMAPRLFRAIARISLAAGVVAGTLVMTEDFVNTVIEGHQPTVVTDIVELTFIGVAAGGSFASFEYLANEAPESRSEQHQD